MSEHQKQTHRPRSNKRQGRKEPTAMANALVALKDILKINPAMEASVLPDGAREAHRYLTQDMFRLVKEAKAPYSLLYFAGRGEVLAIWHTLEGFENPDEAWERLKRYLGTLSIIVDKTQKDEKCYFGLASVANLDTIQRLQKERLCSREEAIFQEVAIHGAFIEMTNVGYQSRMSRNKQGDLVQRVNVYIVDAVSDATTVDAVSKEALGELRKKQQQRLKEREKERKERQVKRLSIENIVENVVNEDGSVQYNQLCKNAIIKVLDVCRKETGNEKLIHLSTLDQARIVASVLMDSIAMRTYGDTGLVIDSIKMDEEAEVPTFTYHFADTHYGENGVDENGKEHIVTFTVRLRDKHVDAYVTFAKRKRNTMEAEKVEVMEAADTPAVAAETLVETVEITQEPVSQEQASPEEVLPTALDVSSYHVSTAEGSIVEGDGTAESDGTTEGEESKTEEPVVQGPPTEQGEPTEEERYFETEAKEIENQFLSGAANE